ncbi:MAG: DUF2878 domain-containing protein [Chromatiales bacterium]|nr:DUF2878 domain-containing protein [Chromatiales bacterium]
MNSFLINIIAFKIAWLASVLGGANDLPLLGPAAVIVAVAIHLRLVKDPGREMLLIFSTGMVGITADSAMISAGLLSYSTGTVVPGMSPLWILGMWLLFATTFNVSFRWLQSRVLLAALLGAVFGPLSYYSGSKIGAVSLDEPVAAMIALAITWGMILPGMLELARRLNRTGMETSANPIRTADERNP